MRFVFGNGRKKLGLRGSFGLPCVMLLMILAGLALWGCGREEPGTVRVGSLKGATSLGILSLMDKAEGGGTRDAYEFRLALGAEELLGLMAKGELDIALVPANVAASFYQRTKGDVVVIDINTLGVLYLVTGTGEIDSVADLKGRTVYLTGKGATPEACLRYVLDSNGLSEGDYALEYKSEASEVAAVLRENPQAVGLLPQPFVTSALAQNEALRVVLDMNREWESLQGEDGGMVTGVTVVRRAFLEERQEAVKHFLEEHGESVAAVNGNPEAAGALAVKAGILAKEEIAAKAIPQCNLVCIQGEGMRERLQRYLEVIAGFDKELVGGQLPGEDFYYIEE